MADQQRITKRVTNATDITRSPRHIDIYTISLAPGESVKVPIALVDRRMRSMESAKLIFLGDAAPDWYLQVKARRSITREEAIAKTLLSTAPAAVADAIAVLADAPVGEPKSEGKKAVKKPLPAVRVPILGEAVPELTQNGADRSQ